MKDLRASLGDHPAAMLEGIAQSWDVAVRGAEIEDAAQKAHVVETLMARMQTPEVVEGVLADLAPEERAALDDLVRHGMVPARRWARQHGEIERMGAGRLERERPWEAPGSAAEGLWYAGLAYHSYGAIGSYRGEVYYVPPELLALLPGERIADSVPTVDLEPRPAPQRAAARGTLLAHDLMLVLSYLRRNDVRAKAEFLSRRDLRTLSPLLSRSDERYIAFLQRLLSAAGLVRRKEGSLLPSLPARDWLRADPAERQRALFETWLDDADWDELARIPSLRLGQGNKRRDPRLPRQAIVERLGRCEPGAWYPLATFVAHIKGAAPDLLRPDGDYDTWYVQDAGTGAYLTGFDSWELVEGSLICNLVLEPLHWLGVIDLDVEGDERALSLTAMGAFVMGGTVAPQLAEPPLRMGDDLTIWAPRNGRLYDGYLLERFAVPREPDASGILYQITKLSMMRSLEEGIEVGQVVAFLRRAVSGELPADLQAALEGWASRYGRVKLARVTTMTTPDEATMRDLLKNDQVRRHLSYSLSPKAVVVEEERLKDLVATLRKLDYWPRLGQDDWEE